MDTKIMNNCKNKQSEIFCFLFHGVKNQQIKT